MNTPIAPLFIAAASLLTNTAAAQAPSQQGRLDGYTVIRLPSLGGTDSSGNSINGESLVAGYSNVSGNGARHATLWLHGFRFDLGTLGGPNSNVAWPVKNTSGLIAGIAQAATAEPLGQGWSCRAFFPAATATGFICRGVVWERGEIIQLPTLGGFNGFATGANDRRQVVGWTENDIEDPTCVRPLQVLQFRPVIWGPDLQQVQELPLLPQDSAGAATAINDRGQVVGISGDCGTAVGGVTARNAVLWEGGIVTDIGNLGGVAWNTPMAINEHGDVVGFSNVNANDGAAFNAQAFLWTRGRGIRPLGTLPGDALSQALGINDRRQIVGISCTAGFASCRAFLWQSGVMTDLNELVEGDFDEHLFTANDINERGEIAGQSLAADGTFSAVWAIPLPRQGAPAAAVRAASTAMPVNHSPQVLLPENVRLQLLRQLGLSEARFAR
jgi:probable HAF family extracellular repeat protein